MSKLVVTLIRKQEEGGGTWGKLVCKELGIDLHTMEQDWEDNKRKVSCIPAGTYKVRATMSPRFGRMMYLVEGVATRNGIRIHPANLPSELQGCIALGTSTGRTAKGKMLLNSRSAVTRFETVLAFQPFTLVVVATPAPAPAPAL